MTTAKHTEASK